MSEIPAGVFTAPDVRLRVWFNDGVHGFQLLAPDQRLAPAAYLADGSVGSTTLTPNAVTSGKIAPAAVAGTNIAPASLTSGNFATVGAPSNGQVLGYNNGALTWTAPGGGVFSLNGTSAYYSGGNVGIGTTSPAATFESNGIVRSTRTGVAGQYVQLNGGDPNSINLTAQSAISAEKPLLIQNLSGEATPGANNAILFRLGTTASPIIRMLIDKNGNVGIGSTTPQASLEIVGQNGGGEALRLVGYQPYLTLLDSNTGYTPARVQTAAGGLDFFAASYLNGSNGSAFFQLNNNGNVGIGTASPASKLEVRTATGLYGLTHSDGNIKVASYVGGSNSGASGGWLGTVSNHPLYLFVNGGQPALTVNTNNSVSVKVLTITGGADIAEPFQVKEEKLEKGSVVVIDAEHPGQLKRSRRAYDKHVAGIVSGANGIKPGISMIDEEQMTAGENVALSGRVYVKANRSAGKIRPGDLLTTSSIPGEAMKAVDHRRAQGSILGKAMTSLDETTGTVLVLVTLQ